MEWYELRLNMCHRKVNELIPFEKEFRGLVKNLKFKKVKKNSLEKFQQDIKMIRILSVPFCLVSSSFSIVEVDSFSLHLFDE